MNDIVAPSWQGKLPSDHDTKKSFKLSSDFFGVTEIYGEGYKHRYFNLTEETAKILFNISPSL